VTSGGVSEQYRYYGHGERLARSHDGLCGEVRKRMSDWKQVGQDVWEKIMAAPFGTVRASIAQMDYAEGGWLAQVEVTAATDPRFEEWVSGWVPPLPFAEAQAECDTIVAELVEYGPGEWIDMNPE
jgi:hypothetical protein